MDHDDAVPPREGRDRDREEALVKRYYSELQNGKDPLAPEGVADHPLASGFDEEGVLRRVRKGIDRRTRTMRSWRVAASLLILAAGGLWASRALRSEEDQLERITGRGETASLVLEDGTKVWLNAESRLSYPARFGSDARQVSLSGEAYFDVAPSKDRPFLIRSGEVTTRVLGTRFNIKAYPEDDDVAVSVLSGRVEVAAPRMADTAVKVQLSPEEQVVYHKSRRLLETVRKVEAEAVNAWTTGRLVYRNTLLSEVAADVERRYNLSLTLDEAIRDCAVSLDLESVSQGAVLEILQELVDGEIRQTGTSEYNLSGPGC